MKFLGHVLSWLLIAALSSVILSAVMAGTLGNVAFLEASASKSGFYTQLAAAIPALASADAPAGDQTAAALKSVLTPAYLQQQTESLLPQLIQHYSAGGPAPRLDLSDLAIRLTGAGYDVPPDLAAALAEPQTITAGPADASLTDAGRQTTQLWWAAPLAALGVIGLIVAVMREHRWGVLIRAGLWTAVTAALAAGLIFVVPDLLSASLSNSATLKPLAPAITSLLRAITVGIALRLLIAAAIAAVAAIILWAVHKFLLLKARLTPKPKPDLAKPAG